MGSMAAMTRPLSDLDMSQQKLLMYLGDDPQSEWMARMEALYPGLEIRWAKSYANGAPVAAESYGDLWDGITLLCCWWFTPPAHLLKDVKFVQITSTGADPWLKHATYLDPNVVFCNGRGTNPPPIAEWVIGSWLANQHNFYRYHDFQKEGQWAAYQQVDVTDSHGRRMGILGYGAIGREVARLARTLNMEVYAYTQSEKATPEARRDNGFVIKGTGDPEGVLPARWFHGGREAVNEFLAQDLDILVLSAPLTESTTHLISHEQFRILSKKKTFVCNVARGKIIDTGALIEALETGQIRGAAVDVTDPDPLPKDHALWRAPNIFITPHVAWQTTNLLSRNLELVEANLKRLASGAPVLNELNRDLGYRADGVF